MKSVGMNYRQQLLIEVNSQNERCAWFSTRWRSYLWWHMLHFPLYWISK